MPDDDAGRDDLRIAANYAVQLGGDPDSRVLSLARRWCRPWMSIAEAKEIAACVIAFPQRYNAETLGQALGLTDALRTAAGIKTIRAVDVTWEEMVERRRERHRQRQAKLRQRRRLQRPKTISQTKPWIAAGISRATWFRRRRNGETKAVRSEIISVLRTEKVSRLRCPATPQRPRQEVSHTLAQCRARLNGFRPVDAVAIRRQQGIFARTMGLRARQ